MVASVALCGACFHAREVETPPPATIETAATPSLFKPGAIELVQDALKKAGYSLERSGKLDDPTVAALADFQERKGLAKTGSPDHETVRRLGLDPDQVLLDPKALGKRDAGS